MGKCLSQLDEWDVIPILNENDSVAIEELKFGDNDLLAAQTMQVIDADLLVLLTCTDGLLDASGNVVNFVDDLEQASQLVQSSHSRLGCGGFLSKLSAAGVAKKRGAPTVIANGRTPDILLQIASAQSIGTFVPPDKKSVVANA